MLTLLQISSTRVFLKTLLTTTDCFITHLFLFGFCFFWGGVSKSIKVHLTISLRKQMDCIKKIKTFSLASCSQHFLVQDICCIFVLGTWVTHWKEKNKVLHSPSLLHFRIYHQWDKWRGRKRAESGRLTHTHAQNF